MTSSSNHLYYDDLEVGQEWESQGRTITETDIVNFACLSGDFNAIHVDHHFAATTAFRKPIAHGMLVMSIGSGLGTTSPPTHTIAFLAVRDWQFKGPVFIGDTIRVRTKVLTMESRGRGRRGEVAWLRQIINQDGKVIQEGITVTLVENRRPERNGTHTVPVTTNAASVA
ncbi:MAG: MaoC/PaaZ C-terminal domain-containing protein [Gemmataceae bacterium]